MMEIETRDNQKIIATLSGNPASPNRVVLVHSLAMDRTFWEPVVREIAADAHVLTYDCRGHGQSSRSPGPYTTGQFADDLADVLDHIGWDSAIVAGASMGGTVALAFATSHPHRTTALGLFDTTAWYGADAPARWRERADKALADGMEALIDFQKTRWFTDAFRAQHPGVVYACVTKFLRNGLDTYAATCHMLGNADLRSGLPSLTMPACIAVGDEDYATPLAMAEYLHAAIGGSTLTVFEKARHFTPIELPQRVAAELSSLWKAG